MNKRQRKKQVTRYRREIERAFRAILRPFVGQKMRAETLHKMGEVGADFIRAQLARPPSFLHTFILEPMLKPPYLRWVDASHVVHWTGMHAETKYKRISDRISDRDVPYETTSRKRICDFGEAIGALLILAGDIPVTCVRCQVYQHERMPSVVVEED